jgi:hypothetical protein
VETEDVVQATPIEEVWVQLLARLSKDERARSVREIVAELNRNAIMFDLFRREDVTASGGAFEIPIQYK